MMMGNAYEETRQIMLDAILAHPEWWTGEKDSSTSGTSTDSAAAADPDAPPHLMFLSSRERDRAHLTTFGLMMHGLPELQMKEVAANHFRAARFLMSTLSKKLKDHALSQEDRDAFSSGLRNGITLTLGREDVFPSQPMVVWGRFPEEGSGVADPVEVRLQLEGFAEETIGSDDTALLHLLPPLGYPSDKDTWLRDSCRALGQNTPNPLPSEALDSEMQKASARAKSTLPTLRDQFQRGLPSGQTLAIKIGLTTLEGGREFVWIKVNEWGADGVLTGTLETEPVGVPGFLLGQTLRVPESDVFDRALGGEQGMIDPPPTDIVAQEFGVDL
jgi:hypothetical protein